MAEQNIDVLNEVRAAANNTLCFFSEGIVDDKAMAQLSETSKSSEQATIFKHADNIYIQRLVDKKRQQKTQKEQLKCV